MSPNPPPSLPLAQRYQAFDMLATLVAVVDSQARVCFANAALEDMLGVSRRALQGASLLDFLSEADTLSQALADADKYRFSALRYDARLLLLGQQLDQHLVDLLAGRHNHMHWGGFLVGAQQTGVVAQG